MAERNGVTTFPAASAPEQRLQGVGQGAARLYGRRVVDVAGRKAKQKAWDSALWFLYGYG